MRYGIDYSKRKSGSIELIFTENPKVEKYVITFKKNNSVATISRNRRIIVKSGDNDDLDCIRQYKGTISFCNNIYDIVLCIDREGNKSYLIFDNNGKLRQYITDKMNILYNPDADPMKIRYRIVSVLSNSLAFYCEKYDRSIPNLIFVDGHLC